MTELKTKSTWQLVFYSKTNYLLCFQQQHLSIPAAFTLSTTHLVPHNDDQPPWFMLSPLHPFENMSN